MTTPGAIRKPCRRPDFLHDDRGSATIWNLVWLIGFGALLGLGLDTTAAMNTKAKLQTVADAASHTAVMDVYPVSRNAVATALNYARQNILQHDEVVTATDVTLGFWDCVTGTFVTDGAPFHNAVRVVATRDGARPMRWRPASCAWAYAPNSPAAFTPAKVSIHGSHLIVLGDVRRAGQVSGTYGMTIEAMRDISFAAQAGMGGCSPDEKNLETDVVLTSDRLQSSTDGRHTGPDAMAQRQWAPGRAIGRQLEHLLGPCPFAAMQLHHPKHSPRKNIM